MKPFAVPLGINRRALLSAPAFLSIPALLRVTSALAQDPSSQLPSWNDGSAKQAIIDFVHATTDRPGEPKVCAARRTHRDNRHVSGGI
jgi:hypothetical protein